MRHQGYRFNPSSIDLILKGRCVQVLHGPEPHAYMATDFVSGILELGRVSVTPPPSAMAGSVTAMIDMTSNSLKGTSDCGSDSSLTPLANGDGLSYGIRN